MVKKKPNIHGNYKLNKKINVIKKINTNTRKNANITKLQNEIKLNILVNIERYNKKKQVLL